MTTEPTKTEETPTLGPCGTCGFNPNFPCTNPDALCPPCREGVFAAGAPAVDSPTAVYDDLRTVVPADHWSDWRQSLAERARAKREGREFSSEGEPK